METKYTEYFVENDELRLLNRKKFGYLRNNHSKLYRKIIKIKFFLHLSGRSEPEIGYLYYYIKKNHGYKQIPLRNRNYKYLNIRLKIPKKKWIIPRSAYINHYDIIDKIKFKSKKICLKM